MNSLSKEIIKEWGLSHLSQEEQVDMVDRIGRLIYQALLVRSLDILSDDEQDELDKILDKDESTPEDTLRFLEEKIPTFELILKEETENLKKDVLVG